ATDDGADAALDAVKRLSLRNLVKLHDAAIVRWPAGARRPQTSQLHGVTETFALGGAVGGLLLGLLFSVPVVGAAAGLAVGAAGSKWMEKVSDLGIDKTFIDDIRRKVTPGTSALFLLTSDAALDAAVAELREFDFELVATNLSDDDERKLRDALRGEGGAGG
ncbi:MAG TPA: DUF1269 domain-containing protein, partial [Euzebyales bacterium]|nr:DUF1269 domain-containing protein [Euzebyales bacterium]